jgi:hypothetical protein
MVVLCWLLMSTGMAANTFLYHDNPIKLFGPVLDRSTGVKEFGFAEYGASREFGGLAEFDQRRVADGVDEVFSYAHSSGGVSVSRRQRP